MGIWARRQRKEYEEGERQRQREAERECVHQLLTSMFSEVLKVKSGFES